MNRRNPSNASFSNTSISKASLTKKAVYGLAILIGGGVGLGVIDAFADPTSSAPPVYVTCKTKVQSKGFALTCPGNGLVQLKTAQDFLNLQYQIFWTDPAGTRQTFPGDFPVAGIFNGIDINEANFQEVGKCFSYFDSSARTAVAENPQTMSDPTCSKYRNQVCANMFGLDMSKPESNTPCGTYLLSTSIKFRYSPDAAQPAPQNLQAGKCSWLWHTDVSCKKDLGAGPDGKPRRGAACPESDRCIGAMICKDDSGWKPAEMVSCPRESCAEDPGKMSEVKNGYRYADQCQKSAIKDLTPR